MLEAAAKAGVEKVVAASSASVYGLAEEFPTTEAHHPYNNRTIYGAAKVFNEGLLRSFNDMYGLNYVALRYFNVYGPRMDVHGAYTEVFIRWMERIASGQAPMIFGDGLQTMDFVHVHDIARANILAAKADVSDEVFNVASGTETSLKDIATTLLAVMGSNAMPEYGPARKVNPVSRRLADTAARARAARLRATIVTSRRPRSLVSGGSRSASWLCGKRTEHPFRSADRQADARRARSRRRAPRHPVGMGHSRPGSRGIRARIRRARRRPHACAVSNCTTALHLALLAVGVAPGDEVITVSHSFIATANAIRYCGATPVFVDIEPGPSTSIPSSSRPAITARRKPILCVHQLGMPCDLARGS